MGEMNPQDFDWITLKKEIQDAPQQLTGFPKLLAKMEENPFVPFGCLLTATALGLGLYSLHKGEKRMQQYMMRFRVAAQGFTFVVLVAGVIMSAKSSAKLKNTSENGLQK